MPRSRPRRSPRSNTSVGAACRDPMRSTDRRRDRRGDVTARRLRCRRERPPPRRATRGARDVPRPPRTARASQVRRTPRSRSPAGSTVCHPSRASTGTPAGSGCARRAESTSPTGPWARYQTSRRHPAAANSRGPRSTCARDSPYHTRRGLLTPDNGEMLRGASADEFRYTARMRERALGLACVLFFGCASHHTTGEDQSSAAR